MANYEKLYSFYIDIMFIMGYYNMTSFSTVGVLAEEVKLVQNKRETRKIFSWITQYIEARSKRTKKIIIAIFFLIALALAILVLLLQPSPTIVLVVVSAIISLCGVLLTVALGYGKIKDALGPTLAIILVIALIALFVPMGYAIVGMVYDKTPSSPEHSPEHRFPENPFEDDSARNHNIEIETKNGILLLSEYRHFSGLMLMDIRLPEVHHFIKSYSYGLLNTAPALKDISGNYNSLTREANRLEGEAIHREVQSLLIQLRAAEGTLSHGALLQRILDFDEDEVMENLDGVVGNRKQALSISEQSTLLLITANALELRGAYKACIDDLQGAYDDFEMAISLHKKRIQYMTNIDSSSRIDRYASTLSSIGLIYFRAAELFGDSQQSVRIECFILSSIFYALSSEYQNNLVSLYECYYYGAMASHRVVYLLYRRKEAEDHIIFAQQLYELARDMVGDDNIPLNNAIRNIKSYAIAHSNVFGDFQ
jgi:hypothetical protein